MTLKVTLKESLLCQRCKWLLEILSWLQSVEAKTGTMLFIICLVHILYFQAHGREKHI